MAMKMSKNRIALFKERPPEREVAPTAKPAKRGYEDNPICEGNREQMRDSVLWRLLFAAMVRWLIDGSGGVG
jgi:hypothetical protein